MKVAGVRARALLVRRFLADSVVALLAGEASLVGGIPQHAVTGLHVEPGRDDGGEPAGQERREVICIHGHDSAPPE